MHKKKRPLSDDNDRFMEHRGIAPFPQQRFRHLHRQLPCYSFLFYFTSICWSLVEKLTHRVNFSTYRLVCRRQTRYITPRREKCFQRAHFSFPPVRSPINKIKKPLSKDKDFFMEHRGIEPLTSRLRTLRSPS